MLQVLGSTGAGKFILVHNDITDRNSYVPVSEDLLMMVGKNLVGGLNWNKLQYNDKCMRNMIISDEAVKIGEVLTDIVSKPIVQQVKLTGVSEKELIIQSVIEGMKDIGETEYIDEDIDSWKARYVIKRRVRPTGAYRFMTKFDNRIVEYGIKLSNQEYGIAYFWEISTKLDIDAIKRTVEEFDLKGYTGVSSMMGVQTDYNLSNSQVLIKPALWSDCLLHDGQVFSKKEIIGVWLQLDKDVTHDKNDSKVVLQMSNGEFYGVVSINSSNIEHYEKDEGLYEYVKIASNIPDYRAKFTRAGGHLCE